MLHLQSVEVVNVRMTSLSQKRLTETLECLRQGLSGDQGLWSFCLHVTCQ